ncbi:MAG: hypothetical protein H6943_01650 [Zoogloeaceae bacterium]|nr:hypothetical protein [Zoogloeaceae bacterium]
MARTFAASFSRTAAATIQFKPANARTFAKLDARHGSGHEPASQGALMMVVTMLDNTREAA